MKNIHVLPTDKEPIKGDLLLRHIWKNDPKLECISWWRYNETITIDGVTQYTTLNSSFRDIPSAFKNQNIYITNDETIKKGDWIHNIKDSRIEKANFNNEALSNNWRKIILTTDQDLIKDGVQAIDDEFLEWFVKNPSCEKVGVINTFDYNKKHFVEHSGYKIIIPKKEPKFKDSIENSLSIMSIANDMFGKKEEPKQEKICTGCGTLSSEELGKNRLGENFLACCPDSDYVNVQEYQEYGLLQHIKMCLEFGNEAQAIRLIEKYSFEKQEQEKNKYSEEDMIAFGKSCFYKGFDKAENDDANCYTAFREEIGNLVKQFKNE